MRDTIDRQAAIDLIMETDPFWAEGMTRAIFEGVKALPSAQPEQRKGKWIYRKSVIDCATFIGEECSECGYFKSMGSANFCPNCGADMRGDEHEAD